MSMGSVSKQPHKLQRLQNVLALSITAWYAASIGNNYATVLLLEKLDDPLQLNLLEQLSMAIIGVFTLLASGVSFPSLASIRAAGVGTVIGMGLCNALTCRLFMESLSRLPLSLTQTIRASSPLVAVAVGTLFLGERYSWRQVAPMPLIVVGFALCVSAEASDSLGGIFCGLASLVCMVGMQLLTKRMLTRNGGMHELQVQLLQTTLCFAFLLPFLSGDGLASLTEKATQPQFALLHLLNGASDYVENVASTASNGHLDPLSFSVADTLRRFVVIVLCGFVLHGNPYSAVNVIGAMFVVGGVIWYNVANTESESPDGENVQAAEKKKLGMKKGGRGKSDLGSWWAKSEAAVFCALQGGQALHDKTG